MISYMPAELPTPAATAFCKISYIFLEEKSYRIVLPLCKYTHPQFDF